MKRSYLEQALRQYDHILSRRPMPEPEHQHTADQPPWAPPSDIPSPDITPAEHEQGVLKKNLGYDPSKSWGDIDANRAELAEKRINERLANPNGASFKQDEERQSRDGRVLRPKDTNSVCERLCNWTGLARRLYKNTFRQHSRCRAVSPTRQSIE